MTFLELPAWMALGALGGWLAAWAVQSRSLRLAATVLIGLGGGILGGLLFDALKIGRWGGFVAALLVAFIGAVLVLLVRGAMRRAAA